MHPSISQRADRSTEHNHIPVVLARLCSLNIGHLTIALQDAEPCENGGVSDLRPLRYAR
jgi:hypothetical protein